MPKNIAEIFASKEKAERTDTRSKAIANLYIELVRKLISKNILTDDEAREIFSNAADSSLSAGQDVIQLMYELLNEPLNGDDEEGASETE